MAPEDRFETIEQEPMITVAMLPGDGVGPEVMDGPAQLLTHLAESGHIEVSGPWPVGATAFAATGSLLPPETIGACDAADAILLGAVGEHPSIDVTRPEMALIELRERYDLRVSIRRIWRGADYPLTVVRNLLGGAYGAQSLRHESDGSDDASDLVRLAPAQIRELAHIAADFVDESGLSLVSADKAGLLATSRLWRRIVDEVAEERGITVRHAFVDRMAYELAADEPPPIVLLTEGIFGDILSDAACGRAGSIALCGSAAVRPSTQGFERRCVGLFEPVHGSAPRHAGANRANPIGGYLGVAALLEWFPETRRWAGIVRDAVASVLAEGSLTYDLAAPGQVVATTSELSDRILNAFLAADHR